MRTLAPRRRLRFGATRNQAGFSLIEITISVAILAGLTAMASAHLAPATGRMRLQAESREIASLMGMVRTRAFTSGRPASLLIDPDQNRLVYGDPAIGRHLPSTISLKIAPQGDGARQQRIVFYPEGGANGGSFSIVDQTREIGFSVDWLTGRITLSEPTNAS